MTSADDKKPEATLLIGLGEYAFQRQPRMVLPADAPCSRLAYYWLFTNYMYDASQIAFNVKN